MAYLAEKRTYRYGGDRLIAEEDATGTIATYLYTDAETAPVAMKSRMPDGTYANYSLVTNPHGDVVAVTDKDGNIVNAYAYGHWGEQTRISESVHQPFRYAGDYFDDTAGLYWLASRFYEPTTGRFISKDSADPDIRDVKSLNAYAYADDAPATHVDPAGTSPVKPRSSGPWKPKAGPPKPKPQPFKAQQGGGGGGGGGPGNPWAAPARGCESVVDYAVTAGLSAATWAMTTSRSSPGPTATRSRAASLGARFAAAAMPYIAIALAVVAVAAVALIASCSYICDQQFEYKAQFAGREALAAEISAT